MYLLFSAQFWPYEVPSLVAIGEVALRLSQGQVVDSTVVSAGPVPLPLDVWPVRDPNRDSNSTEGPPRNRLEL